MEKKKNSRIETEELSNETYNATAYKTNADRKDVTVKMEDVEGIYDRLKLDTVKGDLMTFRAENYAGNVAASHIQGLGLYENKTPGPTVIISHNNKGASKGYYLVTRNEPSPQTFFKFDSFDNDFNHPSGMQIIGDYLVAGVESGGKGKVRRYNLKPLQNGKMSNPTCTDLTADTTFDHGISAVGITNYTDSDGNENYLFVLGDKMKVYFYRVSADKPLAEVELNWDESKCLFSCDLQYEENGKTEKLKGEPQGLGLITQKRKNTTEGDKIYLVAPVSEYFGISTIPTKLKDWCYLFEIDLGIGKVSSRRKTVTNCKYGSEIGVEGVHFRYGAGVNIVNENKFQLLASARLCVGNHLDINIFSPYVISTPVDGGIYVIKNLKSEKVLDISGASLIDGAGLIQYHPTYNKNQLFKFTQKGSSWIITAMHSGKVLDVPGSSTKENVAIIQYSEQQDGNNQKWCLDFSDGSFKIKNVNSGLVMDVKDRSDNDGAIIQQVKSKDKEDCQRFLLIEASEFLI
jgi:hypothetical protein